MVNSLNQSLNERREQKASMVMVLLIFFIGLIVLLSLDFTTNPPRFNPLVLLFGILVAGIIWMAFRATKRGMVSVGWPFPVRFCPVCGRSIPWNAEVCPFCGHQFPPMRSR